MSQTTYKVVKLLGEGSYGKAYLCTSQANGNQCVIKQIVVEGMNEKEKDDTLNEATILQKLDHPNIIKFYEVFMSPKPQHTLNIVTEYADGGDLSQKIKEQKNKPFAESQVLDYFTQICLALKHIHDKKIIHRDLKSGNVFLTQSGLVKLGDFGIAKGFKNTLDKAKTMVGTPYYLSPEIIACKPYDSKSDIWSLGVLLYEMLTFKMPFNASSLPMLSVKIMRGNYTPVPTTYTKDIREIVTKCLNIEPYKRPNVNDILKLPIIKNRILNFLSEVQYNKEFSKTIAKKYKEVKKAKKIEENKLITEPEPDFISGNSIKIGNNNNNTSQSKEQSKNEKISEFFKKKKESLKKSNKEKEENKQELRNFLKEARKTKKWNQNQFNESGVMWGKNQEEVLQKTVKKNDNEEPTVITANKMYKDEDLIKSSDSNNLNELIGDYGSFDVNKMNEDQYNQLRLLNNLNKVANEGKEDSDNEGTTEMSCSEKSIQKESLSDKIIMGENIELPKNNNLNKTEIPEAKNESDDDEEESDFREIEMMRIELEKSLGLKLLKETYRYVDAETNVKEVSYDREKLTQKIKSEFGSKGFSEKEINEAIDKIPEIFGIVLKERANL